MTHGVSVLVVCTGNICRSPVAERLLAVAMTGDVQVSSAGTRAVVNGPICPPMVPLLTSAGGCSEGFAARQLNERLIRDAGLVLTMSREHRAEVVDLVPAAVRRTFTLLEFARLLSSIEPDVLPAASSEERWAAAIPVAAAQRRLSPLPDDIADPFGGSAQDFQLAFDKIRGAVASIASIMTGSAGS